MYLIDTNVFLEVLLGQEKVQICKDFLMNNSSQIGLSDFTLHSIGVILGRYNKTGVFQQFLNEMVDYALVLSLPLDGYTSLISYIDQFKLDFDDAYQYSLTRLYNLTIVSMDKDFSRVSDIDVINFNITS